MTNEEFIASVSLENEEWKEVPSWEGYYAASTLVELFRSDVLLETKTA